MKNIILINLKKTIENIKNGRDVILNSFTNIYDTLFAIVTNSSICHRRRLYFLDRTALDDYIQEICTFSLGLVF